MVVWSLTRLPGDYHQHDYDYDDYDQHVVDQYVDDDDDDDIYNIKAILRGLIFATHAKH